MIYRTLLRVLFHAVLALGSVAAWFSLFYGERFALWWRREFAYAALASIIVIGVALLFARARRSTSNVHASIDTGVTVLGCAAVAGIAYVVAAWIATQFFQ
jgi:hypothetical protein